MTGGCSRMPNAWRPKKGPKGPNGGKQTRKDAARVTLVGVGIGIGIGSGFEHGAASANLFG